MIKNVTVIGAGLMGAGIAAHLTNAGTSVTLLDIPDDKSQNRNNLADQAVSKLIKIKPAAFTLSKNVKLIKTGNIDDHLHLINQSDWVIEVIIEDLKLKKNLYEKIEKIMTITRTIAVVIRVSFRVGQTIFFPSCFTSFKKSKYFIVKRYSKI